MPSSWTDPRSGIVATAHGDAGRQLIAGLAADERAYRAREAAWTADLRKRGVTLAHPDDGWVDRERNTVHFAYPSLRAASPSVGARVALGTHERWRLVELTERVPSMFGADHDRWMFREVTDAD